MPSRVLAESEGPGSERCLEDDAFAVAFEPDVQMANEQRCRWANKYKSTNRSRS